jgi:hypothetical protein
MKKAGNSNREMLSLLGTICSQIWISQSTNHVADYGGSL